MCRGATAPRRPTGDPASGARQESSGLEHALTSMLAKDRHRRTGWPVRGGTPPPWWSGYETYRSCGCHSASAFAQLHRFASAMFRAGATRSAVVDATIGVLRLTW